MSGSAVIDAGTGGPPAGRWNDLPADRPWAAPSLFAWGRDAPWVIDGLVTGSPKRR